MTDTLGYASPTNPKSTAMLRRLAVVSLLWPGLVVALLYGEWLLATWSLGHIPRPNIDDPKDILGSSWVHIFTAIAILGAVPAALSATVLNIIVIEIDKPKVLHRHVRLGAVVLSWAVLVTLLSWNPGEVLYWWFD